MIRKTTWLFILPVLAAAGVVGGGMSRMETDQMDIASAAELQAVRIAPEEYRTVRLVSIEQAMTAIAERLQIAEKGISEWDFAGAVGFGGNGNRTSIPPGAVPMPPAPRRPVRRSLLNTGDDEAGSLGGRSSWGWLSDEVSRANRAGERSRGRQSAQEFSSDEDLLLPRTDIDLNVMPRATPFDSRYP